MKATDIWEVFKSVNQDIVNDVRTYVSENGSPNKIRLIFKDGRKGTFEIQRGKYILEMEER